MIVFNACPDCGMERYPKFERTFFNDGLGEDVATKIRTICENCEWRTKYHNSVKGCADEWNSAEVEE